MYKFCFFRLGRKTNDAEDVVSEVMITAMQKIDELDTGENTKLYNWLATIARYKLLEHYRRQKQHEKEKLFSAFDESFSKIIEDSRFNDGGDEDSTDADIPEKFESVKTVAIQLPERGDGEVGT